jgi:hypothetical protein
MSHLAICKRQACDPKSTVHAYEVRPRKDKRGVDLISDALPFGRLWLTIRAYRLWFSHLEDYRGV